MMNFTYVMMNIQHRQHISAFKNDSKCTNLRWTFNYRSNPIWRPMVKFPLTFFRSGFRFSNSMNIRNRQLILSGFVNRRVCYNCTKLYECSMTNVKVINYNKWLK